MSKIKMKVHKGIWVCSTELYGVEITCMASCVRDGLRGLEADIKYIELNLYRHVIKAEQS